MTDHIPIIDCSDIALSNVDVPSQKYEKVGREFCHALSTWGFAYLKNHGIPWNLVDNCVGEAKKFFEIDLETKLKYRYNFDPITHELQQLRSLLKLPHKIPARFVNCVRN